MFRVAQSLPHSIYPATATARAVPGCLAYGCSRWPAIGPLPTAMLLASLPTAMLLASCQ